MAHCVRLIEYAPEITLIFCLRHRCTKNQSLQVFGRIEQEFNGAAAVTEHLYIYQFTICL